MAIRCPTRPLDAMVGNIWGLGSNKSENDVSSAVDSITIILVVGVGLFVVLVLLRR